MPLGKIWVRSYDEKVAKTYQTLVIDKDLATIEGYDCLGLAANHFIMHKYPSPQDANYIRVLPQLKDMIEKAPSRVKARLNRKFYQFVLFVKISLTMKM